MLSKSLVNYVWVESIESFYKPIGCGLQTLSWSFIRGIFILSSCLGMGLKQLFSLKIPNARSFDFLWSHLDFGIYFSFIPKVIVPF